MTEAQEAYKNWKALQKVSMQVYTDQQMFEIGFNFRNHYIDLLEDALVDKKLAKGKKNERTA